jgi:predicted dehydrogenase
MNAHPDNTRIDQIGAVVVGLGFVGNAHLEALRRLGVNVVGVVGSSPERTAAKAAAVGVPTVFPDLEAALGDDRVDVVHIASPNHLHCSQASSVIAAGKHLVVEKPLGRTVGETAALIEQADATSLVNAVCFNLRYYPLNQQMATMVREGQIGSPRLVTGSYLQDWLMYDTDWNWRLSEADGDSLRAIADIGSHWFDLAQFTTGRRVVEVCADLHTFMPVRRRPSSPKETFAVDGDTSGELIDEPITSDDAAGVLVHFDDGTRGVVTISQVSAGRKNSLSIEIDGSAGALAWFSERAEELWVGKRDEANQILARDPALVHETVRRHVGYPGGHPEGYGDTFRALFKDIYADVLRGAPADQPSYPTLLDGHRSMVLNEAVARSAVERRWVEVGALDVGHTATTATKEPV